MAKWTHLSGISLMYTIKVKFNTFFLVFFTGH